VYAYGVVLLELLTAAEVVDTRRPAACHNLVDWLYSKLHDPAAIQQVCVTAIRGRGTDSRLDSCVSLAGESVDRVGHGTARRACRNSCSEDDS
jgi:hypothetical protein